MLVVPDLDQSRERSDGNGVSVRMGGNGRDGSTLASHNHRHPILNTGCNVNDASVRGGKNIVGQLINGRSWMRMRMKMMMDDEGEE